MQPDGDVKTLQTANDFSMSPHAADRHFTHITSPPFSLTFWFSCTSVVQNRASHRNFKKMAVLNKAGRRSLFKTKRSPKWLSLSIIGTHCDSPFHLTLLSEESFVARPRPIWRRGNLWLFFDWNLDTVLALFLGMDNGNKHFVCFCRFYTEKKKKKKKKIKINQSIKE